MTASVTAGAVCQLYRRPAISHFVAAQEAVLRDQLRATDNATSLYPIGMEAEVQLQPDGATVSGGYRFTSAGFCQVAQLLAPGLRSLLPDLTGTAARHDSVGGLVDGPMAVELFNQVVRLRFPLLQHFRLIRNENERLIEGIASPRYQFLENLTLYEAATDAIRQHQPDVHFYSAMLSGRRFALWFRASSPLFAVTVDEAPCRFYRGHYFCNGEGTGMSARGTQALLTRYGICLGPYRRVGARVRHVGREFQRRLGRLFEVVATAELPVDDMLAGAEKLLRTPLEYAALGEKQRIVYERRLCHALTHAGVPRRLTADIVAAAIHVGRHELGQFVPLRRREHCLFDLFTALLRMARELDVDRRECLEQAAYGMLFGKLLI